MRVVFTTQVYATDGDDMLGGSDFDICLGQHISHHIASVVGTVALDHAEHRFKRVARPPKSSSSSSRSMEPEAATRPRLADVTVTLQEQTNNDAGSSHPLGKTLLRRVYTPQGPWI
jgi:molecular chaperone DnaK (HSP70)